jgi:hypothetical protein
LGTIEEVAGRVIDQIIASKEPYTGSDYMTFITYLAAMAARYPLFLRQQEAGDARLKLLSEQEKIEWLKERGTLKIILALDTATKANDLDLKAFFSSDWDSEEAQQKRYISHFYWLTKTLVERLWRRNWTVLESSSKTDIFVTSDNPIGLVGGTPGGSGDWLQAFSQAFMR